MEDFSPQESPEAGISVVEDAGGPERYQFELLSPAAIMPKVKVPPLSFSVSPPPLTIKGPSCISELYECVKEQNVAQPSFCSHRQHTSEPLQSHSQSGRSFRRLPLCSPAASGSGGFKTVNMQNDILCARWPPTASCEIRWLWTPREHTVTFKRAVWVSALHQRTDTGSSNSKVGGVVQTWLVLKSLKCARKLSPAPSHRLQPGPLMRGRVEPRFRVVCLTFGLYHQSATADMDTLQRRCFLSMICLTLVSLGEYCLLFLAVRSCTRCALHAFRCSSAYVGCNERWFDLLSPSNQLRAAWSSHC